MEWHMPRNRSNNNVFCIQLNDIWCIDSFICGKIVLWKHHHTIEMGKWSLSHALHFLSFEFVTSVMALLWHAQNCCAFQLTECRRISWYANGTNASSKASFVYSIDINISMQCDANKHRTMMSGKKKKKKNIESWNDKILMELRALCIFDEHDELKTEPKLNYLISM